MKVLRRLFRYTLNYRKTFLMISGLTVVMGFLVPVRPLLIRIIIDDKILNRDYPGVLRMVALVIVLLMTTACFQFLHTYLAGSLGQSIIRDLRVQLYSRLHQMRIRFFNHTPVGRLITRNISDLETLSQVFSEGISAIFGDLLQLLMILVFMSILSVKLTLISLSTLPILFYATYIFKERIKISFGMVRTAVATLNTFVQERISGMRIVQVFNSEEREYNKFQKINSEHLSANLKSVMYYSVYFPVSEVIQALGIGLLIWFGAPDTVRGDTQPGLLVAFIMYIQMFFRPINIIADRFNTLQLGIVSSNRIFELLDDKSNLEREGTLEVADLQGEVELDKVWMAYKDDLWILKNISFRARTGKMVAIIGATGSGKSTIVNLITRFHQPQRGSVRIDGKPIETYKLDSLRSHMAIVPQEVFLFSDTILHNITLRNPAITFDQVLSTSEAMGALEFIEKLPGGFDHNVRERGTTLSVGQRQLISFVRAMVLNPRIILLDEATSSVDSESEAIIQRAMARIMSGRTSIVIAHRLSTIRNADNIIVLDNGEIVEEGGHANLMKRKGYYFQYQEMQHRD